MMMMMKKTPEGVGAHVIVDWYRAKTGWRKVADVLSTWFRISKSALLTLNLTWNKMQCTNPWTLRYFLLFWCIYHGKASIRQGALNKRGGGGINWKPFGVLMFDFFWSSPSLQLKRPQEYPTGSEKRISSRDRDDEPRAKENKLKMVL